jgi:hypothetical protein
MPLFVCSFFSYLPTFSLLFQSNTIITFCFFALILPVKLELAAGLGRIVIFKAQGEAKAKEQSEWGVI